MNLLEMKASLKNSFFLRGLSEEELTQVVQFIHSKTLSKGEILFREEQSADAFFILVQGQLKIYKLSSDGREQILLFRRENDTVAEAAIFDKESYPAYCEAMMDSTVLVIPKKEFTQFLISHPETAIKLLGTYSKRLRHMASMIGDLSLSDVKSRMIRYIKDNGHREKEQFLCPFDISKKEIASFLGTTPETVSRVLHQLKKENLVIEKEKSLYVLNEDKLFSITDICPD